MSDKIEGYLEVGLNDKDEIVINHPDLKTDENGVGHIVFSINQAQHLSHLLAVKAIRVRCRRLPVPGHRPDLHGGNTECDQ